MPSPPTEPPTEPTKDNTAKRPRQKRSLPTAPPPPLPFPPVIHRLI